MVDSKSMISYSHFSTVCLFFALAVLCILALFHLWRIRAFFASQIFRSRFALLLGILIFSIFRCTHLLMSVLADADTLDHVIILLLFCLGYWFFFCVKCALILLWLNACSRSRRNDSGERRLILFVIFVTILGFSFLAMVFLAISNSDRANLGVSGILLFSSLAAAIGFSLAGLILNLSLRAIQWKSQLPKIAQRAQKIAGTLAIISIVSFALRAAINAAFWIRPDLYSSKGDRELGLHLTEYLATEILPAASLVVYLTWTSHKQKKESQEAKEGSSNVFVNLPKRPELIMVHSERDVEMSEGI